jgi:hypothetical protein
MQYYVSINYELCSQQKVFQEDPISFDIEGRQENVVFGGDNLLNLLSIIIGS